MNSNVVKLETLQDLRNDHLNFAKQQLIKTGKYDCMAIGYTALSRIVVFLSFQNDEEKEDAFIFTSAVFAAYDVKRYSIGTEAYVLMTQDLKAYEKLCEKGLKIKDHPDSIETLTCIAVSRTESIISCYEIKKDKSLVKIDLKKESPLNGGGRMCKLLPPENISDYKRAELRQMLKGSENFEEVPFS